MKERTSTDAKSANAIKEQMEPNAKSANADPILTRETAKQGDLDADYFRQNGLRARRSLTDGERQKKSRKIADEFCALLKERSEPNGLQGTKTSAVTFDHQPDILCFYPLFDEVDLRELYARLLSEGRQLFFPVTEADGIFFYRVSDMKLFREGAFHVFEPLERERLFDNSHGYIAVTPGVAFDQTGNRIGFGRGYYDRFFAMHPGGYRIGVAFAEQVFAEIPASPTDVPVHRVLSA